MAYFYRCCPKTSRYDEEVNGDVGKAAENGATKHPEIQKFQKVFFSNLFPYPTSFLGNKNKRKTARTNKMRYFSAYSESRYHSRFECFIKRRLNHEIFDLFFISQFIPEPTSQDAKPRVQPGVHPPFYMTNVGGEPRVKPGVWRPEMWAQAKPVLHNISKLISDMFDENLRGVWSPRHDTSGFPRKIMTRVMQQKIHLQNRG
jgi:hypothetical protein